MLCRHYSSWDTEALRHWRLEGSHDGTHYACLRAHVDDTALDRKGATHTWTLPGAHLPRNPAGAGAGSPDPLNPLPHEAFQFLRLQMTGLNSNGHWHLCVSGLELYGSLYWTDGRPHTFVSLPPPLLFEYTRDGDGQGVLGFLATQGKARAWTNPHETGAVRVAASSLADGASLAALLADPALPAGRCVTKAEPQSWLAVDLLTCCVSPTHYTLRHYATHDGEAVRTWLLQGSVDGSESSFITLRAHEGDATLDRKGKSHTWTLTGEACSQSFRVFRVLQTGRNSHSHHFLALGGFEVYGTLTFDLAANPRSALPPAGPRPDLDLGPASLSPRVPAKGGDEKQAKSPPSPYRGPLDPGPQPQQVT